MITDFQNLMLKAVEELKIYFSKEDLSQLNVQKKADQSPLTRIDTEVNDLLCEHLRDKTPEVGWLSEESRDNSERLEKEFCWIIDPIDGTREFIKGTPEAVVSIGLTQWGKPVLGMLYNPLNGEVFPGDHLVAVAKSVLISRSDEKKGLFENFKHETLEFEVCGSIAYKLGLVASGCAVGTVSVTPKNEWDVAAGFALLQQRGGYAQFFDGQTLNSIKFNQKNTLLPGFIAAQDYHTFQELKELFKEYFEEKKGE